MMDLRASPDGWLPDRISVGVLTSVFTPELVDAAVDETFPAREPDEPSVTNVIRKIQFHLLEPWMIN